MIANYVIVCTPVLFLTVLVPETHAQLSRAEPGAVGLSAERLARAEGMVRAAVDSGRITAAAMLVARRSAIVLSKGFGRLCPVEGSPPVEPDSVFLLASITKPVTACALMILVERGMVSLEDPVNTYLPEFTSGEKDKVLVRHILSHTSGLPDMIAENSAFRNAHKPQSEFVKAGFKTPLIYPPNKGFGYQSLGMLFAAEIVERLTGKRLRDFEREEIFTPLGMHRSSLGLGRLKIENTVWAGTKKPPYSAAEKKYGTNSPYWRNFGCPWGGMHSTTVDLAILLQTLLNGGEYAGYRLFSPATVEAMITDQNRSVNAPWGLGWALRDSRVWNFFGELCSRRTFGHVGITGTTAWADPERQLICVILTNQLLEDGSFLRRVSNAVTAAVIE